ncbi:putative ABC transport system permease protein [Clostridium cadaveris]|uniref:Putative ABC transport system permease protein n=1 Tax=Clostridium cadaveris TaxID=1529 RepID=A0A1I2JW03_9CLOT|nr:FtsX-like permease family protein [Clostridium cadaveris]NME64647.1 FtsX-like permease family protein [Clostridium cadaveris]UFH63796.1 FtsX-like permease family protein [Clostridium cadaveris]SFF58238.1 putative ABC transport system permease protein [Clostridium cadaveris]
MFYDLVKRNSKRNRKENGLFFISLIVSIVAFYIILSLEKQDVIIFLKTMESQALDKLFLLIPVLYGLSLFILFFLVYFAGKYQLERRNRELGMYLMLGMKRRKLLLMLFMEELRNSILSLAIGIPIAIFISEIISLATAKIVGLGIIGHSFSFSMTAILGTIAGYFIIRFIALIILSGKFSKKEVIELLSDSQTEKKRKINKVAVAIKFLLGIIFLAVAFTIAIAGLSWKSIKLFAITVILGLSGMFLLFQGIGVLFEIILRKKQSKGELKMFTFRQLQESVFLKPNTMAISSLLILMTISCFAYGIPVGYLNNSKEAHVMDYTFKGSKEEVQSIIKDLNLEQYIDGIYDMNLGICYKKGIDIKELVAVIEKQPNSEDKDIALNNIQHMDRPYLISVNSYNKLLEIQGKDTIELKDNEVALYNDPQFRTGDTIKRTLKERPTLYINGEDYRLVDKYYSDSIVTDSLITIMNGLIVPEEMFDKYTDKNNVSTYWNVTLKKEFVDEKGLMQAISMVNEKLNTAEIRYESYLQNIGRELFYTVSASYTTIYLAVIFLIIANTVMGVQFLMHQQKTRKRYVSLTYLGANYEMLCKSSRNQITWYFSLPIIVSTISSIFAVRSLFTGIMTTSMKDHVGKLMVISIPVIAVICVIELFYMHLVKKSSDKNILKLMDIKREDN